MQFLSQNDARWAADRLGASPLLVGRYGCTTTAISMLSDYFGCYKSPLELAHNAANYTKDGLVIWQNLRFERMRFVRREYGRNDEEIKRALKYPHTAVILQVNDGAHWVVAYSTRVVRPGDYIIIDPWDGKKKSLLSAYRNITGAAYFEGTIEQELPKPQLNHELMKTLAGKLVICPDEHGRLYWIDLDGKKHNLGGSPAEVQENVAKLALGVSGDNLNTLPWA